MRDLVYFRVGVPEDMVVDVLWNDDFEVSMEGCVLKPKGETNYQRFFGTPKKAAATASRVTYLCSLSSERDDDEPCKACPLRGYCGTVNALFEWMGAAAE